MDVNEFWCDVAADIPSRSNGLSFSESGWSWSGGGCCMRGTSIASLSGSWHVVDGISDSRKPFGLPTTFFRIVLKYYYCVHLPS